MTVAAQNDLGGRPEPRSGTSAAAGTVAVLAPWYERVPGAYWIVGFLLLIMPLLAMTVWSFATNQYFWEIPPWFWLYSMVSFFLAFNWEVSRKIRVPEEEIEGVDSYSRLFGTYGAAYLVLLIRVIDTGLVTLVALHLGLSGWFYALLVVLFAV